MNNKLVKSFSLLAGFVLVVGLMAVLWQNIVLRSGVSATLPLGGQTVVMPRYLWEDFQRRLEELLVDVAQDSRFQSRVQAVEDLIQQIKPL